MSASAVDDTQQADTIASVIADAAPTGEKVVTPDAITANSVTFTGHSDVTVSIDADAPVTIESTGSTMDIALPTEVDVSDGVVADDGTVVFEDNGNNVHAAVQALDDGSVRLQTILEAPSAPSTYTYTFSDEAELVLLDDGSVEVTETIADGVSAAVGLIDAPWAIDANGASVPTHYTVDGNSLIQHVAHSNDFAYPITADPSYSVGWGFYIHFNRVETKTISQSGWGPATLASICGAAGYLMGPGVAAGYAAACALYAGTIVYTAGIAQNSSPKRCLYLRYIGIGGSILPGTYRDSRCR